MCYDQEKTQAPQSDRNNLEQGNAQCAEPLRTNDQILKELFSYHPPNSETLPKFQAINQAAKNFAEIILQNCPAGNDRSGAINCIRMARMTANAAIALNGLSL
jgi:hypothetical protein